MVFPICVFLHLCKDAWGKITCNLAVDNTVENNQGEVNPQQIIVDLVIVKCKIEGNFAPRILAQMQEYAYGKYDQDSLRVHCTCVLCIYV